MKIYKGNAKKWHTPYMQKMSQQEVNRAIALSACSGYVSGCSKRCAKGG